MAEGIQESGLSKWLKIILVGRRPKLTLVRIFVVVLTAAIVFKFVLIPIQVRGHSMEPTYNNNSINFINRLAYLRNEPQRGDVVLIRMAAGGHVMLMKRVVGLPGESISFSNGFVCVDGTPQPEPYLKWHMDWELPPRHLGPEEYFYVGDNRSMPPELHEMGVSSRTNILGRVLLKGN